MTLEERFSVQIKQNEKYGFDKLYFFIKADTSYEYEYKLDELTKEEFDNYEIDLIKDKRHKCSIPYLLKIK